MRIVIIGGSQRSGTTFVQTLIANALPNAPVLPEAHIVYDLLRAFQRAKSEWKKTSRFYETEERAARYFRATIETHVDDIKSRYGAIDHLVLKDPSFTSVLTEIEQVLPEAVRIVCVRDPRDIVASYIKIGQRQAERNERTRYTKRQIFAICKKVNAAYQPVLDGTAPAGCVTVRYEELVADPAGGLRRLAEQTGLPFDPAKIAELKWLEDEYRHQETWRTPLEGGPASTESVGTYRQELTALERAQTELACNTIIRKFGYQPDSTPRNWSTLARLREAMFGRTHKP